MARGGRRAAVSGRECFLQAGRRCSIQKAKQRAEEGGPAFFLGLPALVEVAKENGIWNWVLLGPDPSELPLQAGGPGGVQEMRHAIGKHAHSFGLLRMSFGVGEKAKTTHLFVHASSDATQIAKLSMKERGEAMFVAPEMERAVQRFAAWSAKVRIHSQEECTVERFVKELRMVRGMDDEVVTPENLNLAARHPVAEQKWTEAQEVQEEVDQPRAEVAEPQPEVEEPQAPVRQRASIRLFKPGDMVEVYSVKHRKWITDAVVTEVVNETCERDGFQIRAGSMRVVYNNKMRFKWVPPQHISQLRPSGHPKPPDTVVGRLRKEMHDAEATHWRDEHVEVSQGFLQWWSTEEDARTGKTSDGWSYLLGLQQHTAGDTLRLRTHSTRGTVYTFKPEVAEEVDIWVAALWEHAGYCEEMREYADMRQSSLKEEDSVEVWKSQSMTSDVTP